MNSNADSLAKHQSDKEKPIDGGHHDHSYLGLDNQQEQKRSNVRIRVTYGVTATYCFGALGITGWLMWLGKHEIALGVFSGLAGVASSIIGYWFGSRHPKIS